MRCILSSFGFVFITLIVNGMIKLVNVVGARPQIIKAVAISRAIKNKYGKLIDDIHGVCWAVLFEQLEIPLPKHNL